jgi:hypothetical protein
LAEAAAGAERCHIITVVTNIYFVCSVCSNRETALRGRDFLRSCLRDRHLSEKSNTVKAVTNCKVSLTQAYLHLPLSFCLLLACRPH